MQNIVDSTVALQSQVEKACGFDFSLLLMLGYTGLSDQLLKQYIRDNKALWEGKRTDLPVAIVGTHAGPDAVAVAFFAADTE